jgi:arginyl-tRNA synthetase
MPGETSKNFISHLLALALSKLKLTSHLDVLDITAPPDPAFGDYSSNAGLILAKKLKTKPKEIAGKIIDEIKRADSEGRLEAVTEQGGFINFKLSQKFLLENLGKINEQRELYGCSLVGEGKKVVFEYSSPNTNKPLHIGHTRNDVYGKACINLLKASGYQVVSCEIINDRGIHIMKSVLMYIKHGADKTPQSEGIKPDHFVGEFYQMFAEEAGKSQEGENKLLSEAQELLQKWEAGDAAVRKVWQQMNDWFFEGVKETYDREGSTFDEVNFESQIYDKGREIVMEGVKKGQFIKEADGSVSVDFSDQGLDKKTLLRKDGTTLYITQDMYLWHLRNEKHHPYLAAVTTSAEQAYHFKVLKKIFELLGYPWAKTFKHLPYEHVFLGNSKMSSRQGNTITADDMLKNVKERIVEVMKSSERVKAKADNDALVEQVAFGAIKYGYLKYEPNTRIYFDLEQTISIEGNTGPYIQYAHARIRSILKGADTFEDKSSPASFSQPLDLDLLRKLLHYGESVEMAAKDYKPNLLCNYLYELAHIFNAFYQLNPVLQEKNDQLRSFRLQLITATAQVLKNGLYLLGIEAPEEM